MSTRPRYNSAETRPDQAHLEISLTDDAAGGFLVCLCGRLSLERAEKLLPGHSEIIELERGDVAVFVHIRAERARALIERLAGSACHVRFTSQPPAVWAASLAA